MRGANVAAGYWQGKELKPVLNEEGWFHTGDIGELDAEGNLYFKGRKKNVIVTREGMNVYPEDLEAALRQQPEVRDCVVVGLEQGGNAEPCAVLMLRDSADPQAAVKRANQHLAEYQQMRRWMVWPDDDFPRTPTQKPRTGVIQAAVAAAFCFRRRPRRRVAKRAGRSDRAHHRPKAGAACSRGPARRRLESELDGSR